MRSARWGAALAAATVLVACSSGAGDHAAAPAGSSSATSTTATTAGPDAGDDVVIDGATVSLGGGLVEVAAADVGSVDLTTLPLGSDRDTGAAAVGDVYTCAEFDQATGGGNDDDVAFDATWIHDDTFDLTAKLFVAGDVAWDDAEYSATVDGDQRVLAGNALPVDHHTGEFPVAADDPASAYKPNPTSVEPHTYTLTLPANPTPNDEPGCVGGEVGVLMSGIPLFSALDAEGLDALAEEVWDTCWGHPNVAAYHYHAVSSCIPDPGTGHSSLVGYAFDGFGIYGHRGEGGEVLTNDDLDECHGHTHAIEWDGEEVEMYHYHATWEFPYVVGCFRGTSAVDRFGR